MITKEYEVGLITHGPLSYFKFKLKMAYEIIIYQKLISFLNNQDSANSSVE